jgi:hypothetical protein
VAKSSDKHDAAETDGAQARKTPALPRINAPSTQVNLAFPFSQIKLEEPSKELVELTALVLDLVVELSEWVPQEQLEELRVRAQTLRDRLR